MFQVTPSDSSDSSRSSEIKVYLKFEYTKKIVHKTTKAAKDSKKILQDLKTTIFTKFTSLQDNFLWFIFFARILCFSVDFLAFLVNLKKQIHFKFNEASIFRNVSELFCFVNFNIKFGGLRRRLWIALLSCLKRRVKCL